MASSWVVVQCVSTGRFLINRRSMNEDRFPGCWGLWGGRRNPPESAIQAATREFAEETGVIIAAGQLRWLCAKNSTIPGNIYKSDYYLLRVGEEFAPTLNFDEAEAAVWLPASSLPSGDTCHPALALALDDMVSLGKLQALMAEVASAPRVASTNLNRPPAEPDPEPDVAKDRRERTARRKTNIEYSERLIRNGYVAKVEMLVDGVKVAEAGVGTHNGRLYGLKTEPDSRGRGYAKMLLSHLLASDRPPTNLNVAPFAGSPVDREGLVAFYNSFGFEVVQSDDPRITRMEKQS